MSDYDIHDRPLFYCLIFVLKDEIASKHKIGTTLRMMCKFVYLCVSETQLFKHNKLCHNLCVIAHFAAERCIDNRIIATATKSIGGWLAM